VLTGYHNRKASVVLGGLSPANPVGSGLEDGANLSGVGLPICSLKDWNQMRPTNAVVPGWNRTSGLIRQEDDDDDDDDTLPVSMVPTQTKPESVTRPN
jgi:hypothetical protein